MKTSELAAGVAYVARRSTYDLRYKVEFIRAAKIEIDKPTQWRPASVGLRCLVEIKESPYGEQTRGWGRRLDGHLSSQRGGHEVGEQLWMEARYIEEPWADHLRMEQASKDNLALATAECDRVEQLAKDAGLGDFIHVERSPYRGMPRVSMSLSQHQVERLAVFILEEAGR